MFDVGFSEVLLIFVIALVVLGPEKLPRLASQVGRWVGRARAMARQFREQLEEEVNLEQVRKAQSTPPPQATESPGSPESPPAAAETPGSQPATAPQAASAPQFGSDASQMPKPEDFRADTFSHAHPTNEFGANPDTPDGAPPAAAAPAAAAMPSSHEITAGSDGSFATPSESAVSDEGAYAETPVAATAGASASRSGTGAAVAPTDTQSPADEPKHS